MSRLWLCMIILFQFFIVSHLTFHSSPSHSHHDRHSHYEHMSMHCAASAAASHRPHVAQALQAAADCGSSNVTVSRAALLLLHREVGCHFTQEIMSYMHSNSLRQREDLNFHDVLNFCCLLLRLLLCNLDPATGAATLPSRRQQGPATLSCLLLDSFSGKILQG